MSALNRVFQLIAEAETSDPILARVILREIKAELTDVQAACDASLMDSLTGLPTRQVGELMLRRSAAAWSRGDVTHRIVMIDMDGLKNVNDSGGHEKGDEFLADLGTALRTSIRPCDFVCRWGGDEFLIILEFPEQAGSDISMASEERVRRRVKKATYTDFSWGSFALDDGSPRGIRNSVAKADRAMFLNKKARKG